VDGATWASYGEGDRKARLADLHARLHRGSYRAMASKRAWIPKGDGRMRPLGIAAVEDKVVQQAAAWVLGAIYEADFLGVSYGFRPGRRQHDALDARWVALTERKVNWVLDCDIRSFFARIVHERLIELVERRVGDRRVVRLLRKWLRAGVLEDGRWSETTEGTPQGAVISPLLANIYLHYVLDQWVMEWRRSRARGEVYLVRYADDFVMGFQHRGDAERLLADLRDRLAEYGLELHQEKTRLFEFGRFAGENRAARGQGKPETFDFLGFTHTCGKTRKNGRFTVLRQTIAQRLRAKLQEVGSGSRPTATTPCPSWARGYAAWSGATSTTTPCPATGRRCGPSARGRPGLAARAAAPQPEGSLPDVGPGAASLPDVAPIAPHPAPVSQRAVPRQTPGVRAV